MEHELETEDIRKDAETESDPSVRLCPICRKPLVECDGCYDDADLGE